MPETEEEEGEEEEEEGEEEKEERQRQREWGGRQREGGIDHFGLEIRSHVARLAMSLGLRVASRS